MKEKQTLFNKRAFTIKEAAEYACVSRATVENWLIRGILPFEELPSRGNGAYCFRRIRKNDLDAFLNNHYQQNSFSDKQNKNKEYRELILLPLNS
jgi:excisionase family DNA binding protein